MICKEFMATIESMPSTTKFFPEYEDVFVEEQMWLKNHLLPLYSFDLGDLNTKFKGNIIHIVNPLEPYEGYIGDTTKEFHNEYTCSNWFAFKINTQNKYEFLGTQNYFSYKPDVEKKVYFEQAREAYLKSKLHFSQHGEVVRFNADNDSFGEMTRFGHFGGALIQDNWTSSPPSAFSMYGIAEFYIDANGNLIDNENAVPENLKPYHTGDALITYKDKPFYLIGFLNTFTPNTPGKPVVLFEPENKIVLYVFQY